MPAELPTVLAAFLCERVLQEQDKVLTAVRIVDRILYHPPPPNLPADQVGLQALTLLVILKKADAPGGKYRVDVSLATPNGEHRALATQIVDILGEEPDEGVNLVVVLGSIIPEADGLYWVELRLNETLAARSPLRLTAIRPGSGDLT